MFLIRPEDWRTASVTAIEVIQYPALRCELRNAVLRGCRRLEKFPSRGCAQRMPAQAA
jgi:hypothetical protein